MKYSPVAIALAVTSFVASPAIAASITMLQFGSFETREEAQKRLVEVTTQHADLVKSLPVTVNEVKLPPDNLTVYRTQAGPVLSRVAAQAACAQISAAGEACYIVETALLPSSALPVLAEPVATAAEAVAGDSVAPDLTRNLSTLAEIPVRDPSNSAALASVSTQLPEMAGNSAPALNMEAAGSEVSPAMQAALDKAAAEQANLAANVDQTVLAEAKQAKPKRSFWSRLNPFSDDEPEPAELPVVEQPVVAPAPIVMPAELPPATPALVAPVAPLSQLPPVENASSSLLAAQVSAEPVVAGVESVTIDYSPVITQLAPMDLPPPPAPSPEIARVLASRSTEEAILVWPVSPPSDLGNIPVEDAPAVAGAVRVEEARRVPLSKTNTFPPVTNAAPVSLVPNASDGRKTIWAQIGPFSSTNQALQFWESYRQAHPDFPVVRVRAVAPYQQHVREASQSWLRVGPMARVGFVNSLCASLPQGAPLECGAITDMGASAPR